MYESETGKQRSPMGCGRAKAPTVSPLVAVTRTLRMPQVA